MRGGRSAFAAHSRAVSRAICLIAGKPIPSSLGLLSPCPRPATYRNHARAVRDGHHAIRSPVSLLPSPQVLRSLHCSANFLMFRRVPDWRAGRRRSSSPGGGSN